MVNRLLKWLNNNLLPINYKVWRENQDKVYEELDDKLKPSWISIQHSNYNMLIPVIIFLLLLTFEIIFRSFDIGREKFYVLLVFIILLLSLAHIVLSSFWYNKYVDEKYLKLSAEAKKGGDKTGEEKMKKLNIKKCFLNENPNKWIYQAIFEVIILGLILFLLTLCINMIINPNPHINLDCYKEDNNSVVLVLHNPSRSPGEEINMMVKIPYSGGSWNYPENELCNVSMHAILFDSVTKIFCDYIPPKSKIALTLTTENKTNSFYYSLWGRTTKKVEWANLNCEKELTDEVRELRGEVVK
jgi:hypothetical protein